MVKNNDVKNLELVLIPGLNNTGEIWDDMAENLSENISCHKITCSAVSNIDTIAKQLLDKLPEKFYLCGFSFGGFVALSMLELAPERIQGIVLMATTVTADTEPRKIARAKAIERANEGEYKEMIGSQVSKIFYADHVNDPKLLKDREKMLEDYGANRFIAHQEASIDRVDHFETVNEYTGPILIVTGKQDQVMSVEGQRELSQKLSNSIYKEIDKSGHMLPMEQPKEVAKTLQNWLENQLGESNE